MDVLPEPIIFEWDKGNEDKSIAKHGVSNKEVEEACAGKPILLAKDTKHSKGEQRYRGIGKTTLGTVLFLAFTIRHDRVRVISARRANRKERRLYEEAEENTNISI